VSGYYYSREPGAEGQILTGEGTAPGVGLDVLAERERPPLRVAIAIGSAMADLLCIAAEDQLVHGDIRPAHVKIDEGGQVSIEGFGVQRRTTRAPEGKPEGAPVDIYGLGVVLHSILSAEPLGNLPKDADAHDDEVVSRVLAMDFREVQGRRWLEDVRKFLCQILAWAPGDRPAALDAANVLASVAGQCPGETLEEWAARTTVAPAPTAKPAAPAPTRRTEEEDLGGPVSLASPIAKGGVRVAPAAKGESTAFWSREKIAAMLAEDDDDDAPPVAAPRRETVNIPSKPKEPAPPRQEAPRAEPRPEPVRQEPPRQEPVRSQPRSEPAREARPPEPRQESRPASPFAGAKIEASTPIEEDEPPKKTSPLVWVVVGVVVLGIICAGLTLGGGGLYYFVGGSSTEQASEAAEKAAAEAKEKADKATAEAAEATAKAETTAEATKPEATEKPETAPEAAEKPETKAETTETKPAETPNATTTSKPTTTTSKPTTTTSKPTTTTSKPTTTTSKPTTTTAAPAGASFSVKFSIPGHEGKLQCGDGQTADFAGATTMSFEGTTTCLVRIGSGKGAVQVSKSATVTCSEDAGKVSCGGN
jgi:hypothetical protein